MSRSGGASGQSWGITYADVAQAHEEHESSHHCIITWGVHRVKKYRNSPSASWVVVANATRRAGRADEVRGSGSCDVGGSKGAASFAGALLRAMMDACDDLDRRAQDKRYDRDHQPERLPGM